MEAIHVWYAEFDVCHTKFDICCMPCFIDLCQFFLTCYTPNLMYLVSSFVCDVLKFLLKTLSCDVNFNTSCMIIGSGIFKFVHVASPVIYAILRLPLLLYRLFSFLAYQLPLCCMRTQQINVVWKFVNSSTFFRHPIQWEIIITCRSLMILNYKAQKLTMVFFRVRVNAK